MVIQKSDVLVLARPDNPIHCDETMRCGQHTRLDNSAFKSDVQASQSTGSSFFETTITREGEVALSCEKPHHTQHKKPYQRPKAAEGFGSPLPHNPLASFSNYSKLKAARDQVGFEQAMNELGVELIC